MAGTDGRRSAQGGRVKPSFEYKIIPENIGDPGQSEKDLGTRWGIGENAGPRTARRRATSPVLPGGLRTGTVPEGTESRRASLDQPVLGTDRPREPRLDQASKADDQQKSLDQPPKGDTDRPRGSLDQSPTGDIDRLIGRKRGHSSEEEESSDSSQDEQNPEGARKKPGGESEGLEYAESRDDREDCGNQSTDDESARDTAGSGCLESPLKTTKDRTARRTWKIY
ncbi:hypothetical protein BJ322DRAFT_1219121 [Thelephora terrestris]|uniref:Uncharacterized protein n=1 Tax=Thelephora terrestris TaxID=56493 RepID=A0A9P6L621_9AGAM|nr:hypothetical protein BJ322DRAFT_1219121 [Thelephora terrestris]